MNQEGRADTRGSNCRDERIWQIVNECLLRRENGESVSDESIIEQHPELMPELGAHLRNLNLIQKAGRVYERATAGPSEIAKSGIQGLQVRCPHCRCSVEVVIDTPLAEITCNSCGSIFSLVGDETLFETWDRGRRIAQFELVERLGVGGFGTVWKARDTELDRMVAVKIPRARHLDPAQVEMFFREARAAAQLNHTSIVNVHEVGREGETIYIVTDLAQGIPLSDWIKSQPYTPHDAAKLCREIAQALHHAHEKGIIHRDLKPHNIMIDGDLPQLMDFGLARREAGEITMTIDGQVLGTPAYMSPEQAKGEAHRADRRSDIYSLGVIFYELLTGELPFRGNARMLIQQVLHDQAPSPRKLNGSVPRDLETICLRCLEKEPYQRYSTAEELSAELGRFLKGEPIHSRSVTALGRAWRWCKRYPAVSSLGAALLVVLLSGLTGVTTQWFRADRERQLAHEHRDTANRHLYQALVDQARALRLARAGGYRGEVFGILKQALSVDTPVKNVDEIRQAAIACMGDFVGLEPTVWDDFPAEVRQIASRPLTTQVAIGLDDGTLLLRDLANGAELATLPGHSSPIRVLAFGGPRAKILASGDENGSILLWKADAHDTWSCEKTFPAQELGGGIDALAISPDGKRLLESRDLGTKITTYGIAEESDDTVTVELALRDGKASEKRGRAFSPDGTLLATSRMRNDVYELLVWDITKGQILKSLETGLGFVNTVSFSRDGRLVVCACADGAAVFDSTEQWTRTRLPGDVTPSVALGPRDALLAIASWQLNLIRLWSLPENREVAVLPRAGVTPQTRVVFSDDGKRVAACGSRSVRIWSLADAEKLNTSGHTGGVPSLAFSPDGTMLASGGKDHTVRLWDPITGDLKHEISGLPGQVNAVAFNHDGRMLATGDWSGERTGTVLIWDTSSGQPMTPIYDVVHHVGRVHSVAFSPNGKYLAASGDEGATVWPVQVDPRKEDAGSRLSLGTPIRLATGQYVGMMVFSPDGRLLAWAEGRQSGIARVWDLAAAQEILAPPLEIIAGHYCIAFHPNSKLLTFVSHDKAAELWDVTTRRISLRYAGPQQVSTEGVRLQNGITLSRDGRWAARVVATDLGQSLTIWDLESQNLLVKLPEERGAIWDFAWSPDRNLLAVGTSSGGPVIWNIPKIREQLAELGLDW